MLKIVQAPSPVLATPASPIEKIDASVRKLILEMTKTLEAARDPEGVGLAAPQVGKSLRLFIIKQTPDAEVQVFINPKIDEVSPLPKGSETEAEKKGVKLEGCLSMQDIWGVVHRSPSVRLTYTDETGKTHTKKFSGFFATIIQHEFDHIEGILFPRRVLEQNEKLYKAKKDKKGESIFEEMSI